MNKDHGYYFVIPANIFHHKDLSANAKLMYGIVSNFCDRYGKCTASNKFFAEAFNKSENTVSRWISELEFYDLLDSFIDFSSGNKRILTLSTKIVRAIPKNDETYPQKWGDNTNINNINNNTIVEIIDFLNETAKTNFKSGNKSTQGFINGRIAEGYTIEDFKSVITTMGSKWIGTEWEEYLRPSTLFTPTNFEKYLNSAVKTKKQKEPIKIKA
jgi:uncharacterized phage protein (TIGR02220 family)